MLDQEKLLKSFQDLENILIKKDSEIEELKNKLELAEKRSKSYFGLNQDLKEEIVSLKEQISHLESKEKDMDTVDAMDIKKASFLDDFIKKYDDTKKNSLLDKFAEVDNKNENEQKPVIRRNR